MPQYKAPLRDTRFLINEVLDYPGHYAQLPNGAEATPDVVDSILDHCAKFCEGVLAPLNQSGDKEGCTLADGNVSTPKGFKEAYDQFVEGGWQGLSHPEQYGGQGMPMSLGVFKAEMMGTANWSFNMYPGLSLGAMNTIMLHGTDEQRDAYMPPLTEGRWMGTMCLTEPQCGTDLGQVSSKAVPRGDGSYDVTGTKIFISAGDHDLCENIVHVVLARLPGAPAGTRGISLFIIPKFLPSADGGVGEFNNVTCSGIEHKMGIKASATCTIEFEGSRAFMLGPENKGLECMFTFMNTARIGTALQGVCATELAYQGALAYAQDRRSMRALSGKKEPDKVADAIHHHGDVRRLLLTMKAISEGGRAMLYHAAKLADHMTVAVEQGNDAERELWDERLGFYTPILKGFLTEIGFECTNMGVQVFGGHGYIGEHGMEQIVRDTRISTLYEGTTGIQALDLLGRKVLIASKGKAIAEYTAEIMKFCGEHATNAKMRPYIVALGKVCAQWNYLTLRVAIGARKDRDVVAANAVDFLMYSGYAMMAFFWAKMMAVAFAKLESGDGMETPEFYKAKIQTGEFYFDRVLPRSRAHAGAITAPVKSTMQMPIEAFFAR
ncbi:MAG: acyl-CoA dehydrogenase C-terminal domain-containing protein [Polyangiales bacterium]